MMKDQHSVAFRATLETTSSIHSITEHIQSWIKSDPPISVKNQSLIFNRKYPVGIIHPQYLEIGFDGGSESLMAQMRNVFTYMIFE